ncbi:MAG: type II toxin-antitoxin system ParD family antitoxin [Parafilimonas terrae]|nr:type II toxin-antitoxin system ParD family antitoxin [Parafilimonas terrae]
MADIERLTVVLTEPMATEIRAAVESGEYASTSEVVHDAVRLWAVRRQGQDHDLAQLRQVWDAGMDSGTVGPIDCDGLRREARRRLRGAKENGDRTG